MGNPRQEYIAKYAEASMEQMKRYGIPASVILAQGIIESGNGQSELSRLHNNHFGVKATAGWLEDGGEYAVYTDDKPDEKFCKYATVNDSYEHHSRFLIENSRYANLFKLNPDDYVGWTIGLQQAGYASSETYAAMLQSVIRANGLDKYDQQVMAEMQGKQFGVTNNHKEEKPVSTQKTATAQAPKGYSFPIHSKEFLLVTSPFGMRADPMDNSKQQMHKGIDIRADHVSLMATEDGGKVIAVCLDPSTEGGKSVTVEYERENGAKMRVFCCHLDSVDVKVGDVVKVGQQIGITGNTGQRTAGPHLHLGVTQVSSDGSVRDIDPVSYLADIAIKGGIQQEVMHNGENLLNKYVPPEERSAQPGLSPATPKSTMSPENWMMKLLTSEDAGAAPQVGGDSLLDMIVNIFTTLMALALGIDNKPEEEQMQKVTDAALSGKIDLTGLVQGVKDCALTWPRNEKPEITMTIGDQRYSHTLTDNETRNLSAVLQDPSKTEAEKQQRLNSFVGQIVIQQQLSDNYEQSLGHGESQGIQR